jgi:hypothetical protein
VPLPRIVLGFLVALLVAVTVVALVRDDPSNPIDDLSDRARAYVLPDARERGADTFSCPANADCAGPEWPPGITSGWVVVSSVDEAPAELVELEPREVLAGDVPGGPITARDERETDLDHVQDALDDGLVVVAGISDRDGDLYVRSWLFFDRRGRFAFTGFSGANATALAASDAAASQAESGATYFRDALGWNSVPAPA